MSPVFNCPASSSRRALRCALRLLLLCAVAAASGGCDKDRGEARAVLEQWLTAHVAQDFKRVVALTADATFSQVARSQEVAVSQVRADMPKLLKLAPEKLVGFRLLDGGQLIKEGEYAFVVQQQTTKQGRQIDKKETVHVVRESETWRVDPTRTAKAKDG